ncbi:putative protein [Arabidopsis thaliana]|nr:putative protein [Arabidopsis thaliana]CAB79298.1 putative protein [Arabidopsis thaliana]
MWFFGSKGASGFSSRSTAEEVTHGVDGTGLTAIVTGASSGIGVETARVLSLRGVHVVMAVRNTDSGAKVKEDIVKQVPGAKLDVMELDLSSMQSVRKFASEYKSTGLPLNLLIGFDLLMVNVLNCLNLVSNNAGIMACPFMLSKDNIELQFATNHLGHFLLTKLLLDTMKSTSRESKREGRIVNLSSEAHRFSYPEGVRFDKINDKSSYSSMRAYGQSKLCNVLHANELTKQLKGAATTCYVALNPQVAGVSGEYFQDSNIAKPLPLVKDTELAKKVWDFSTKLTDSQSGESSS